MKINIHQLHKLCKDNSIMVTEHAQLRCRVRGISYDDILTAMLTGEIIESYPDDYPYPSALIMGTTLDRTPLHIVAGASEHLLWIITAYIPDSLKWEPDCKTRKAV